MHMVNRKMAAKPLQQPMCLWLFCFLIIEIAFIKTENIENVLNVPQVLLPFASKSTKPTTFLLKAYRGCFRWSSTRPNVATIAPVDDKSNVTVSLEDEKEDACSLSALITVKLKSPDEDSTVILAEEEGTGLILRCDVFVDSIYRIEIATTARELLLGESPEVFDVYGYDKEGNLFSSLGSEKFEWSFQPVHLSDANTNPRKVLRFLWFHDSLYETISEIYELEQGRNRGYSILVEGVATGEAILTAKLTHPDYKIVKPSSVKLTVIDNIMLIPPDEYIMVHQKVKYDAQQLRRRSIKDISLPSDQYDIMADESIGKLYADKAIVEGIKLGVTKIQLIDQNMGDFSSARRPTANLHVVEPSKLGFAINPGKLWMLQAGKTYEMHVRVFDEENNRIRVDNYTLIESMLPGEYFEIHKKSVNGSYYHVTAKQKGKTLLTATLDSVAYPDSKKIKMKQVYGEQAIEIYDPIVLTPEDIIFPWEPTLNANQVYKYQLKVEGGSANYIWTTLNSTFVSVNKKGLITTGNHIGEARIKVSDMKNPAHSDDCIVKVLPPAEMAFILGVVEVEVGKELNLPISVTGFLTGAKKEIVVVQDCRRMSLKKSFSNRNVFDFSTNINDELPEKGCTSITVQALKAGHTTLTATYAYADVVLRASIVIGAYYPVKVIDPVELATVTLGSSKLIIAEDGPLPWPFDEDHYDAVMSGEEEDWVQITPTHQVKDTSLHRNLHHFNVKCTQLGDQLLTVVVGNRPTVKNMFPASSSATTRFSCAPPASMKLLPQIVLPMIDGNRRSLESCKDEHKRIPVRNQRQLRLNLYMYDNKGNLFDDVSSLNIKWSSDNKAYGEFLQGETLFEIKQHVDKNENGGYQAYQNAQLYNHHKPLAVTAQIISYKQPYSEHSIKAGITANSYLMLMNEPVMSPDSLSTYAHPSNKFHLDVIGGTGHFVLKANDNIALVQQVAPNNIAVTPQDEGQQRISLYDQCLDASDPARAVVTLSDVYALRLAVGDKMELGQSIDGICQALDQHGHTIDVADVSTKMKLRLKSSADIFDISPVQNDASHESTVRYNLTGKAVGMSSLTCHAVRLNGQEISSKSEEVQVFSSIELEPKYVLLIVGAIYQVHSRGGPQPQSTTVYSLDNDTVADVNQAGLVTARVIGKTILTGKAKGVDSTSGKEIVYSKDTVIVEVVQLKGFKISLQSRTLVSNAEVGILAVGITDEGPFTFATSSPYLQFDWSTSNHEVAVVESLHYQAGVSVTLERDFRAVLRARSSGFVTVRLKVKVLDDIHVSRYAQLEDTLQVQVFDQLRILHPASGKLLLPPNAVSKIQTNRDQLSRITYTLLPTSCQHPRQENLIKISPTGEIHTFSSSGVTNAQVTAHEDFGYNQTAVIQVEVAAVASVTLVSLTPFIVKDVKRPAFPLGVNVLFGVTLHDKMGRLFDVSNVPLKHRTSRSDIIQVVPNNENGTFDVRGTVVGETLLKVWQRENPSVSDYIRITITEGISPIKVTVQLGELVCFNTPVNSESGFWSASSNLLHIDQKSGVGVGAGSGAAMIYYSDGAFRTYAEVITAAPKIRPYIIEDEELLFVSNLIEAKYFKVVLSEDQSQCLGDVSDLILPFRCEAQWSDGGAILLNDVFDVQSTYVHGRPACLFKAKDMTDQRLKQISTADRNILLKAVLYDKGTNSEYPSSTATIRFIPQVYVEQRELNFNANLMSQVVEIQGSLSQLSGIKLKYDTSRFEVKQLQTAGIAARLYEIGIKQLPRVDESTTITIYSPLTKSNTNLDVTVRGNMGVSGQIIKQAEATEDKEPLLGYFFGTGGIWFIGYTIIIATIVLIVILYHFITRNRQPAPVVVASPYPIHHSPHSHSPPPYQYTSPHASSSYTPQSYSQGKNSSTTPQRTLFSVSQ